MTIRDAIAAANDIRPNALDEKVLAGFLHQLDADFAETLQVTIPGFQWPEDQELLMPTPVSRVYILWLCAMIDWMQEDTELYRIDQEQYSLAYEEAKAWWRRHNRPAVESNGAMKRYPVLRKENDTEYEETETISGGGSWWDPLNQRRD